MRCVLAYLLVTYEKSDGEKQRLHLGSSQVFTASHTKKSGLWPPPKIQHNLEIARE